MLSFFFYICCDSDKESSRLAGEELVFPQYQSMQEFSTSMRATQLFALYVFTPGDVCSELALCTQKQTCTK
jgi:hypothetical protein